MPTVGEVWKATFPAAQARSAGHAVLSRTVGWVRVLKPRVPAFDALESGDLAILPEPSLRELAAGPVGPDSAVEALAAAGGAAVLVLGSADDEPATAAVDRATALGLGAFVLAEGEAAAVERAVIGFLVNGRAELERQAASLESTLERLALEGRELADHAAAIGRFLGRAVAIEGPGGEALAVHAPAGVAGAAGAAGRYLGHRRRTALRTPFPGRLAPTQPAPRRPGRPPSSGNLVLLGPEPATELDRVVSERVVALLALELSRGRSASAGALRAGGRVESLPVDGPPWVAVVARQVTPERQTSLESRERLRGALRRLDSARRFVLRGDAASLELRMVAVADGADPHGLAVASKVSDVIGRPVAVSRPFAAAEDRPSAEAEARATLEAVEALGPDERARLAGGSGEADQSPLVPRSADTEHVSGRPAPGGDPARGPAAAGPIRGVEPLVARADRLPAYRLLAALPALPDGLRWAQALLGPVLSGGPRRTRRHLETLRAALDHPGLAEAAHALGIHRNTLAYRLGQIEAVTGWRLDDPALRFSLGIAVRLVQSAQVDARDRVHSTPHRRSAAG